MYYIFWYPNDKNSLCPCGSFVAPCVRSLSSRNLAMFVLSFFVSRSVSVCVCVCSELIFDIRFHVAPVWCVSLLRNEWLFEWNNVKLEQSISFSFSYHSHSLKIDRLSVWSYDTQNNGSDDDDVHIYMAVKMAAVHMASFLS